MPAPFRIYSQPKSTKTAKPASAAAKETDADTEVVKKFFRERLDQLVRLVPAEIVALYIGGTAVIGKPGTDDWYAYYHMGWSLFCLFVLFIVRRFGNRETPAEKTQWHAIGVSASAFLVWVYYLKGGPCAMWPQIHRETLAGLLVLGYTTIISFIPKKFLEADPPPDDKTI